ncbi:hypothetical protein EDD21DRAFT_443148 [Dissophora ornata]|nr:hypothetical protein EDD21DRAFT_443148 [Dissophora ornata]
MPRRGSSRSPSPSMNSPSPAWPHSPHPFLQSPTHARSSSLTASLSPSQPFLQSHTRSYSHSVLKDASSVAATSLHKKNAAGVATVGERTHTPEELSPTAMMSFASGFSLHSPTTTIAKPVALYPQEHPPRKRFSPRFSASAASYTTYSSALASTIHQQQQLQQEHQRKSYQQQQQQQQEQQQQQQQQHRHHHHHHHDSVERYGGHNKNGFISSPPSPCHCSHTRPGSETSMASSSFGLPEVFPSVTPGASSLSTSTSMSHCSPILSHTLTLTGLLPDVVQFGQQQQQQQQQQQTATITGSAASSSSSSYSSTGPSSPVDRSMSMSPPSSYGSMMSFSNASSLASSPVSTSSRGARTRRTSSTPPLLMSANANMNERSEYFVDRCVGGVSSSSSPSPSPPLQPHLKDRSESQLIGRRQRRQGRQKHQQPHSQQQQQQQQQPHLRRHAARQSLALTARKHEQSAYLFDAQQQQQTRACSSSTLTPASPFFQQHQHQHHHNYPSSYASTTTATRSASPSLVSPLQHSSDSLACTAAQAKSQAAIMPPSSPQAIALSSSRYIRFLWLPLLPLLILAVGGQTSAKFESPVKYSV